MDISEPPGVFSSLDRLPWSAWHLRMIIALGITWLLDGLEGSLGGSLAGALKQPKSQGGLGLNDAQLGLSSSLYLIGAVCGALLFGYMADRLGRRKLFFWTLILYALATASTSVAWNLSSFTFFRILTGAGIGGEYAAINSAIDELMPARLRGRIDLWINGTFWLGIVLGSLVTVWLLGFRSIGAIAPWRLAFYSGIPIVIVVLLMRRVVPESPRWLVSQGLRADAERVLDQIELEVSGVLGDKELSLPAAIPPPQKADIAQMLSARYRSRTFFSLTLMVAQAFFYNSVFFSLPLVLLRFYGASANQLGPSFVPIALANFAGPLLLGHLFDRIGRRKMIALTYSLAGLGLLFSGLMFLKAKLDLHSQIAMWSMIFFFASTAASSAYLTVSEIFPQSIRASAIAIFYALGTLSGGVSGPLVFGHLIGGGHRSSLFFGYVAGALGMVIAGIVALYWGIDAEGKTLEQLVVE